MIHVVRSEAQESPSRDEEGAASTSQAGHRPVEKASATGMVNRKEVKIQTRGPDEGNPTPRRQGHR